MKLTVHHSPFSASRSVSPFPRAKSLQPHQAQDWYCPLHGAELPDKIDEFASEYFRLLPMNQKESSYLDLEI